MPGPTKRTRSTPVPEDEPSPLTPAPTPIRNAAAQRRTGTAPSQAPTTTRPILTRSAATPPGLPQLTRSSSFATPTRRPTGPSPSVGGFVSPATIIGSSRGGMLLRTQSTPSIASPIDLKAGAASGGSAGRGKGDDSPDLGMRGVKRWGKGKENIAPKKDGETDAESEGSRKRMRIGRRSSGSVGGRGRSGSVSSMRSEGGSARQPSLAPTTSSSFSRASRLPSPSPSLTSITTPSLESIGSFDPIDSLYNDKEVDRTPTKTRAAVRRYSTFPTPPPSSPLPRDDLETTTDRISLVRMTSDKSDTSSQATTQDDGGLDHEELDTKKNPYKHLKSFLRLSATSKATDGATTVDQTIVGRQHEKAALRNHLMLQADNDVGMYVSGPPGTGKTATVTAIGRELTRQGWQVVEIGCMGLRSTDVWRVLGESLRCGKSEADVMDHLERKGAKTFIILDEIDSLLPSPPALPTPVTAHLLTKLFSLPSLSTKVTTVKLIAISNTLDLTLRARLVLPDDLQPQVLPFKAYAGADMVGIVTARLSAASQAREGRDGVVVDPKAIELLTKKVEAQNGDLRMCLGCLSSAVSLAEAEWTKKVTAVNDPESIVPLFRVALPHTIKAFNSYTQQLRAAAGSSTSGAASPTAKKIRSVPLQGKMVLVALLLFLARTHVGLPGCPAVGNGTLSPSATPTKGEGLNTNNLYATYVHILSHHQSSFPPAAESDYRDLLSNLEVLGLVSLTGTGAASACMTRTSSNASGRGKAGSAGKVQLYVREDEIWDGLGLGEGTATASKGLAEEEVGKVWQREESRVKRMQDKLAAARERTEEGLALGDE